MKKFVTTLTVYLVLVLQLSASSVRLQWDPNPETDIAGYRVHRGIISGTRIETRDVGNITIYDFTGLVPGVTNYFTVTAYNTAGLESGPSNELSYEVTVVGGNPSKVLGIQAKTK